MEDLLQTVRYLKTKAKNRRDRSDYESAVKILSKQAIPLIENELSSTSQADWRAQLASELADCHGIVGGLYRRWALDQRTEPEQRPVYLRESFAAYQRGYELEKNPDYNIVNSYNLVNRLISYILLKPDSLSNAPTENAGGGATFDIKQELEKAASVVREQLKEKRRGDIWALADLALVSVLLGHSDPHTAYADFNAKSPPDYAYESALSTLQPLADLDMPIADQIREAKGLLKAKLDQLQSAS
jgi:hypothetical protein